MNKDLETAKVELNQGEYTCVLVKEAQVLTSTKRGGAPLLGWIEEGIDLRGYSAADKVVGRGAAMLYVLMGIKVLYAAILSKEAEEALKDAGIEVYYGEDADGKMHIDEDKNKKWYDIPLEDKCYSCAKLFACMNKSCPLKRIENKGVLCGNI